MLLSLTAGALQIAQLSACFCSFATAQGLSSACCEVLTDHRAITAPATTTRLVSSSSTTITAIVGSSAIHKVNSPAGIPRSYRAAALRAETVDCMTTFYINTHAITKLEESSESLTIANACSIVEPTACLPEESAVPCVKSPHACFKDRPLFHTAETRAYAQRPCFLVKQVV